MNHSDSESSDMEMDINWDSLFEAYLQTLTVDELETLEDALESEIKKEEEKLEGA